MVKGQYSMTCSAIFSDLFMLYFAHGKAASVSNTSDVLCDIFPGQTCSTHQQKILH